MFGLMLLTGCEAAVNSLGLASPLPAAAVSPRGDDRPEETEGSPSSRVTSKAPPCDHAAQSKYLSSVHS